MSDDVWEYRLDRLEGLLNSTQKNTEILEKRINEFESAEAARERKWLLYGIMTLGGVVSTLIGVIWSYRFAIFGGGSS